MSRKLIVLCCLLLAGGHVSAASKRQAELDPTAVRLSIEYARVRENSPFTLSVFCTGKKARRAMHVYPNGIATWDNSLQVKLPWPLRNQLLGLLLQNNFQKFETRYGDTGEADDMDGALRVSCRIHLGINGLNKTSEQLYDGPQHRRLLHLANTLLDFVQPLAAQGTGAGNLGEGLEKLAGGELDPQILRLRYVALPARASQPGQIVRISGARYSRQSYAPGQKVGPIKWSALSTCRYRQLLAALEAADFAHMPLNLWSDKQVDVEVGVLNHHKAVIARPFKRLLNTRSSAVQKRFATLLGVLDGFDTDPNCATEN